MLACLSLHHILQLFCVGKDKKTTFLFLSFFKIYCSVLIDCRQTSHTNKQTNKTNKQTNMHKKERTNEGNNEQTNLKSHRASMCKAYFQLVFKRYMMNVESC